MTLLQERLRETVSVAESNGTFRSAEVHDEAATAFCKPVNPVTCPECSSSSFRLSRFRMKDLERLLLLQYPVRCRQCHRRLYAGLPLAMMLLQAGRVRRERRSHEATR